MKIYINIILILIFFSSCKNHLEEHLISINNLKLNQSYFSSNTVVANGYSSNKNDSSIIIGYFNLLKQMKEPNLSNSINKKEVYRFIWDRSFFQPLIIRIEKEESNFFIYCKLLNASCKNDSLITVEKKINIDYTTWHEFKNLLNKLEFWKRKPKIDIQMMLDGDTWIIEGRDENYYNVLGSNFPSNELLACGQFLLNIAKIDSSLLYVEPSGYSGSFMEYPNIGKVYRFTDVEPKFGDNDSSLTKFINDNLSDKKTFIKNKISGKVYVGLIIYEDGSVHKINIKRGIDPVTDSACTKLFKKMPKWSPGKVKDELVKTEIVIPISFKFDK